MGNDSQTAFQPLNKYQWNRQLWVHSSNKLFRWFCLISAILLCILLFSIVFFVAKTGFLTFKDVSLQEFFLSTNWSPEEGKYGAALFIIGTLLLTAITMVMAVPLSIGIAVFVSEISPDWLKRMMRPVLDLLVGIPSVIYGYIGATVLIPVLREVTGVNLGDGIFAAALVLTLMILPTISRISDESITSVPRKFRDAAYALGSTRFQVISRIILPAAKNGIITAIILGMARALGETMAVVMVIGNTAQLPDSLFTPTAVLTSNIVMQINNVQFDSTWSHALYMMAFILLFIALLLIFLIRMIRPKGANM